MLVRNGIAKLLEVHGVGFDSPIDDRLRKWPMCASAAIHVGQWCVWKSERVGKQCKIIGERFQAEYADSTFSCAFEKA